MKKPYERTWHLKINLDPFKDLIHDKQDEFFCPFSKVDSYLNIYKDRECEVQFYNLQHCDYSKEQRSEPNRPFSQG